MFLPVYLANNDATTTPTSAASTTATTAATTAATSDTTSATTSVATSAATTAATTVSVTEASDEPSEFKILHCNNPDTKRAEMKVEVSKTFLFRNGGLNETWAAGFEEETTDVYTKTIQASDLVLDTESTDPDSKLEILELGDKLFFQIFTLAIQ